MVVCSDDIGVAGLFEAGARTIIADFCFSWRTDVVSGTGLKEASHIGKRIDR